MKNVKTLLSVLGAAALLVLSVTVISAASGDVTPPNDIPATARTIDGQMHTINGNSALWYKFDYNAARDDYGMRDLAKLTLANANGSGLGFEVFTPAQIADWWEVNPVGQGTAQQIDTANGTPATYGDGQAADLTWLGSFMDNGTYYVRVTNANAFPMNFDLNMN